jgi:hypothetical protein
MYYCMWKWQWRIASGEFPYHWLVEGHILVNVHTLLNLLNISTDWRHQLQKLSLATQSWERTYKCGVVRSQFQQFYSSSCGPFWCSFVQSIHGVYKEHVEAKLQQCSTFLPLILHISILASHLLTCPLFSLQHGTHYPVSLGPKTFWILHPLAKKL